MAQQIPRQVGLRRMKRHRVEAIQGSVVLVGSPKAVRQGACKRSLCSSRRRLMRCSS